MCASVREENRRVARIEPRRHTRHRSLRYGFPDGNSESAADDDKALHLLEQIEGEIQAQGIQSHSIVETEVTYERILRTVRDFRTDLIVLDTRAIARLGSTPLGTVARRLLVASPCPILAVSPAAAVNFGPTGRWRHVLAATDFSPASLRALHHAQSIAGRKLAVICVADDFSDDHEYYMKVLRYLAPMNESDGVSVEHTVRAGEPGVVIAEQVGAFAADLVVLGSPLNELKSEQLQTSTVLQVILNVRCPVLCVPPVQNTVLAKVVERLSFRYERQVLSHDN